MTYALIYASRELRPYFDVHKVVVLSSQPLERILYKLDAAGRMLK